MALAFEQQPKESEKAFAAFSVYLSMGPERSLSKVGRKLGKSKTMMEKWCRRFEWPARIAAYAAHMALVEREAAEAMARVKAVDWAKRYQELREAEWQMRKDVLDFAAEVLRRWMERTDRCGRPEDYVHLVELASKLGHNACEVLADGHRPDGQRTEVTGKDGGPIRIEVELALKKIYGQPLPGEVVDVDATPVAGCKLQVAGSSEAPCGGPSRD